MPDDPKPLSRLDADVRQLLDKRREEDLCYLNADFLEALAATTDTQQQHKLVENVVVEWVNIQAHWLLFLVPGMLSVEGYAEALIAGSEEQATNLTQRWNTRRTSRLNFTIAGYISRWKGRAIDRARKWQRPAPGVALNEEAAPTPRMIIGRWMKNNELTNATAAKRLGISEEVLPILKAGTAVKEKRLRSDELFRIAKEIGCAPDKLDHSFAESGQMWRASIAGNEGRVHSGTLISDDLQKRDTLHPSQQRRTPDLETSCERIELVNKVAYELAVVKQETQRRTSLAALKQDHPTFVLWTLINDSQTRELVDGATFTPKAYAQNLVLAKYGLTSPETLKKDRRKLRRAKDINVL